MTRKRPETSDVTAILHSVTLGVTPWTNVGVTASSARFSSYGRLVCDAVSSDSSHFVLSVALS